MQVLVRVAVESSACKSDAIVRFCRSGIGMDMGCGSNAMG